MREIPSSARIDGQSPLEKYSEDLEFIRTAADKVASVPPPQPSAYDFGLSPTEYTETKDRGMSFSHGVHTFTPSDGGDKLIGARLFETGGNVKDPNIYAYFMLLHPNGDIGANYTLSKKGEHYPTKRTISPDDENYGVWIDRIGQTVSRFIDEDDVDLGQAEQEFEAREMVRRQEAVEQRMAERAGDLQQYNKRKLSKSVLNRLFGRR